MVDSVATIKGLIHPVVTPRVQLLREKISLQELEYRLMRLGFPREKDYCEKSSIEKIN